MRSTVLTIFGTRPEAIKLAPVVRELERYPSRIRSVVCVTAQHREMLDQVLSVFELHPDFDLDLMTAGQTFGRLVPRMLEGLDQVLQEVQPDLVIVQGDTYTAFCGALAAFHRRLSIAHVEAGLRTHDRRQPFPEEVNRRLVSQLADWHFAPTRLARINLRADGIDDSRILVTGNTVVDALKLISDAPDDHTRDVRQTVLVTAHRRESFGEPLGRICQAVAQLADEFRCHEFIFPVHPNPHVRSVVDALLGGIGNVKLIEPLDYVSFTRVMRRSKLILTDSGGVQEEAPSLGVPVLVLRDESDRPESIAAGAAELVGTERARIVGAARRLLTDVSSRRKMNGRRALYGDGQAARRIVEFILAKIAPAHGHVASEADAANLNGRERVESQPASLPSNHGSQQISRISNDD